MKTAETKDAKLHVAPCHLNNTLAKVRDLLQDQEKNGISHEAYAKLLCIEAELEQYRTEAYLSELYERIQKIIDQSYTRFK